VALNAEAWDRFANRRPEVFIPMGGGPPPTPPDKGGGESRPATLSVAARLGKGGAESPPTPLGKGGEEIVEFAVDQRVRVVRAPHKSQIGTIARLLPGMQVFPSGVQGRAAEVRLEDGNKAILPLANLEVLV